MKKPVSCDVRSAIVLIGALVCLSLNGCEQMSTLGGKRTPHQGPAPTPASTSGSAGAGVAAGTTTAKADPAGPAAQVKVGKQKIALATFEVDRQCQRMVAPFEVGENLSEIASLLIAGGGDAAAEAGSGWVQGESKQSRAGKIKTRRHQISESIRTAAVRMNWLPMDAEVAYGRHLLDEMKREILPPESKVGLRLYPPANRLLEQVLSEVKEPYSYNFQVYVRGAPGQNAAALPGGFVVLDAQLLQDPALHEKALFALSHEIAHVLQRHQTRTAQARIIDSISLRSGVLALAKSIAQMRNNPGPVINTALAGKLQFERHYAAQELQADACATVLLDRVLNNRKEVVQTIDAFVKRLPPPEDAAAAAPRAAARRESQLDNLVVLVARPVDVHPTTTERLKNFAFILAALQKRGGGADSVPAGASVPALTSTLPSKPSLPVATGNAKH